MKNNIISAIAIIICISFITAASHAAQVNPSTDFESPLDTTLWSVKYSDIDEPVYSTNRDLTATVESGVYHHYGNGPGGTALKSNFYYIGDFDVTVDAFSQAGNSAPYVNFRFFNYGIVPAPYTPDKGGDYGVNWGLAGSVYGWFMGTYPWLYGSNITGYNSAAYLNTWYQLRIQRVGDDIVTYYKLLTAEEWTIQNVYTDFGAQAVYLEIHMGTGTNAYTTYYIDNFTSQGYADTDPLSIPVEPVAIPEPVTMISLLAAIAGIKFRNLIRK